MDGNRETKFIFCPRCGGIMEPPVCGVCGFDMRPAPPQAPQQNAYGNLNPQNGPQNGQQGSPQQGVGPQNGQQGGQQGSPQQGVGPQNGQQGGQQQNYAPQQNGQNPPQTPQTKVTEEKKKKVWIPIVIAGAAVLILAIICAPTLSVIKTLVNLGKAKLNANNSSSQITSSSSKKPSESESESEPLENEDLVPRHFGRFDHPGLDFSFYESMADCSYISKSGVFDPYYDKTDHILNYNDSGSVFDSTHTNHSAASMGPDYYEPFCDCIDQYTFGDIYQIHREYFYYDDAMGNQRIQANIAFPQLTGNIPNLDALNQEIYDRCASDFLNFLNGSSPYSQYVFETIVFGCDPYITYNDGAKMSILCDCFVHTDDYWNNLDSYIYAINVDLKSGTIIENDDILDMDEAFAKEFRERCLTQNGSNNALDPLTDKEILQFLQDKENNIIFFTPLGLEVGMHQIGKDDILSRGWETITLKYGTFENNLKHVQLQDQGWDLRKEGNPTPEELLGDWGLIDEKLGLEEEKEVRSKYPGYGWNTSTFEDWIKMKEEQKKEEENHNSTDPYDWEQQLEELEKYYSEPEIYGDKAKPDTYFKFHKGKKSLKDGSSWEEEESEEDSELNSKDAEDDSETDSEESEKDSEENSESDSGKTSGKDSTTGKNRKNQNNQNN